VAISSGQVGDFYHLVTDAFEENVDHNFREATKEAYAAADECAKELRHALGDYSQLEDLPEREAEHYEKGWKAYKHKPVDGHVEAVVANANAPQLTHLVEKGHELFVYGEDMGRRTKARPHIRDAYERARSKHFTGGDIR
jgi:hypothetical protein